MTDMTIWLIKQDSNCGTYWLLAEAFRIAGYDGIVYGSKPGEGKNIAIFDLTAAQVVNCSLCRVDPISLKYSLGAIYVQRYCHNDVEQKVMVPPGQPESLSDD